MITTQKSHHTTNSWSHVTIRELQARKHNQLSTIKCLLRKTMSQKRQTFHDIKVEILEFSWNKIRFKTLNLLKTTQRSWNFTKNCQEGGDRSLIFTPLFSKIRVKTFWNSSFSTDFYIWYLKLTSRFKTRTLKLAFSKFQPWSNTKVKKIYKSKKFTLVTRH